MIDTITVSKGMGEGDELFIIKTSFDLYDDNPDFHTLVHLGKCIEHETGLVMTWTKRRPYRKVHFSAPFGLDLPISQCVEKAVEIIKREYKKPKNTKVIQQLTLQSASPAPPVR